MASRNFSQFGKKKKKKNGITQLMSDLGNANHSNNPNTIMLGGGNPAIISAANDKFISELEKLI